MDKDTKKIGMHEPETGPGAAGGQGSHTEDTTTKPKIRDKDEEVERQVEQQKKAKG